MNVMLRNTLLFPVLVLGILLLGAGQDEDEAKRAALGKPAPDFTLTDSTGRTHHLADYRGRIVILEWTNPDCPYVQRQYKSGAMPRAYAEARKLSANLVWLAVDSTYYTTAERSNHWISQHKLKYPILLDTAGEVGRRYDARTSPHMFVIDAKGLLRYHGAIDDNQLGKKDEKDVTNYVVNAVRQIAAGEDVKPEHIRPWGCSVKYKGPEKK
jgi:peroxiredoxin